MDNRVTDVLVRCLFLIKIISLKDTYFKLSRIPYKDKKYAKLLIYFFFLMF